MLKALIVDDEELACKGLKMRLDEIDQVEVVGICQSGKEALAAIVEKEPDLVFLDIQMPGMSGFDVVREIQVDLMPLIVFVTAYDAYAVDAFKIHAVDYLLKPVEEERLKEAVERAVQTKTQLSAVDEKQRLLDMMVSMTGKSQSAIGELLAGDEPESDRPDRLAIKDGSTTTFVPVRDIDWIDAAGDYMCIHVKGETHIMRTTMKELEAKLDPSIFQRVHRSTIVNLQRVDKVSSHINGEYHLILSLIRIKLSTFFNSSQVVQGQFSGTDHLAHDETGVYVRDPFDAGDLIEQKFLVVLHVGNHHFKLVICRLACDQRAFHHFRIGGHLPFKFLETVRCVAVHGNLDQGGEFKIQFRRVQQCNPPIDYAAVFQLFDSTCAG